MVAGAVRLRRGLVALAALAVVYGLVAQATRGFIPTSAWVAIHEIESVELLPTYSSLADEVSFLEIGRASCRERV